MPNDCWSNLVVTGASEEIERFLANEFVGIPDWAFVIQQRGIEAIKFKLWSPSIPDYMWLEGLLINYNTLWIKNIWNEEGGMGGIWIGSNQGGIRTFQWEDMCIEEWAHRFRTQ